MGSDTAAQPPHGDRGGVGGLDRGGLGHLACRRPRGLVAIGLAAWAVRSRRRALVTGRKDRATSCALDADVEITPYTRYESIRVEPTPSTTSAFCLHPSLYT